MQRITRERLSSFLPAEDNDQRKVTILFSSFSGSKNL
jgi:hypothetical protein